MSIYVYKQHTFSIYPDKSNFLHHLRSLPYKSKDVFRIQPNIYDKAAWQK